MLCKKMTKQLTEPEIKKINVYTAAFYMVSSNSSSIECGFSPVSQCHHWSYNAHTVLTLESLDVHCKLSYAFL